MTRTEIILFGALGGMCPTIAKLASTYSAHPGTELPALGFWIGVACFAILGAIIATCVGTKEVKAAVFAGIAAPGIVTNIVAGQTVSAPVPGISTPGPTTDLRIDPALFGIATAFAQPLTTPSANRLVQTTQIITIIPQLSGGAPKSGVEVFAIVPQNGGEQSVPVGPIYLGEGPQLVSLPMDAVALTVGNQRIDLDGQSEFTLNATTSSSFGSELIWALGGQRQYDVRMLQVAPVK